MKEEFLHYLWKYGLYDHDTLRDASGEKIVVVSPGEYNRDSGPDFFNARIITGGTQWAGNVEIHIKSSHFDQHGHNSDHAFDNVILHIVAENDRKVFNARGGEILTVAIGFDKGLYERYLDLVSKPCAIACQDDLDRIDKFFIRHWLHCLSVERLTEKSAAIEKILASTGNDWEETFYRMLSRYFGFRVNTQPFEMLAAALPFRIIRRHSDNRFQVEALLFGTAGMLEESLFKDAVNDDYYRKLVKEYRILATKYSLKPIHGWLWKFSRLRPVNFPTLRISQLAAMLATSGGLFSRVMETDDAGRLRQLFATEASEYWNTHFIFGRQSRQVRKSTGTLAADILLINAVIPVVFVYGRLRGLPAKCEKALGMLEDLPAEDNLITREWKEAGVSPESAFESQALLQLRNSYCRVRRCLDCRIGCRLVSMGKTFRESHNLTLEP
ncbi:MAG: DUF2851 family protein [Bacteroidales bacterium]|jgi:hypothetical protein|nr:DUF2851 family protein [Bacteroidales bacterium]